MVDIKRDRYILGQSEKGVIHSPGEEIRIDLNLSLDGTDTIGGTVYGVVEDNFSIPIQGALVKIMSTDYDPLKHAVTDALGSYIINNVPVDKTFKIYAIAQGKALKESTIIAATLAEKIKMDFTLDDDDAMKKAVIAGDVFISPNLSEPIGGAVVSLYSINGSTQTLKAVTDTNKFGQFTFREVELGRYSITITGDGYYHQEVSVQASSQGQIIPIKVGLNQDPNNSKGTVSGVIKDELGKPINRGDVILYEVEEKEDGKEDLKPVAFTKTNSEGVYLFSNVKQSKYKIKSNESEIINIPSPNSPYFYGFSIANASILQPKLVSIFDSATAHDGAISVLEDKFIAGLGGSSETPGWMEIAMTPDFAGEFNFNIKYLSGNEDTTIVLKRDSGYGEEEFILNFPKTNGWKETDAKIKSRRLAFHAGQNRFKLFAEVNKPAPWIGEFSIVYVKHAPLEKSVSQATVRNEAIIQGVFITNIGGANNGEARVIFDIPFTQPYQLTFKYLAADESRPLKIDIDGENQHSIMVSKTAGWFESAAKIQKLKVYAEEGEREFKFYNDTNQYGPNVGYFTLEEYKIHEKFLPTDVIILESAEIKKDVNTADYIGGIVQGNGKIKFTVEAFETHLYDFKILYRCEEDKICNVKIKYADEDYEREASPYSPIKFPATENNVSQVYTKLFLHEGENTITIYND